MWRRVVSLPRGARSFKKVAAAPPSKKKAAGGRDQYGAIKQAILAEPDEELFLPTESREEMEERKAKMEAEISGLKEGLAILEEESPSGAFASFIQVKEHGH